MAKRWTKQEDERLINMYEKGLTYLEIGNALNRSSFGVLARISNFKCLGLIKPKEKQQIGGKNEIRNQESR